PRGRRTARATGRHRGAQDQPEQGFEEDRLQVHFKLGQGDTHGRLVSPDRPSVRSPTTVLDGRRDLLQLSPSSQRRDAGWSSLVARRAHNPKVACSNHAPATLRGPQVERLAGLCFRRRSAPPHRLAVVACAFTATVGLATGLYTAGTQNS